MGVRTRAFVESTHTIVHLFKGMFGLKMFVQVQTFWWVPPVLPRNFCHPGSDFIFYSKRLFFIDVGLPAICYNVCSKISCVKADIPDVR